MARSLPDTCSVDIAERAAATDTRQGAACMTFREIAVVLGTDAPSVLRTFRRGARKVRLLVLP